MSQTGTTGTNLAKNGIALLAGIAMAVDPNVKLSGLAISELEQIANGIIDGVPEVVSAWDSFKAAREGGAAPTPEAIAALRASVDAAAQEIDEEVQAEDAAGKA